MDFTEMSKIDVSKQTEKKGMFSYLSWPYAVAEFRKACPDGIWDVEQFGENNQPYCQTDSGCFVQIEVVPDVSKPDITFTQIHPVLDNKNKTIKEPNAFQVNTSIMRCLVKAIALATGIGLYIYAGEDLPEAEKKEDYKEKNVLPDKETNHWLIAIGEILDELSLEDCVAWWPTEGNGDRIKKDLGADNAKLVFEKYQDIIKAKEVANNEP